MNLQQLYYFKNIASTENYSRSAEQLLVSQSSLSHAIAGLEQELGVPLFYKSGRNIRLSEYGHCFLSYVERSLHELENGRKTLETMSNPCLGTIRLTFVNSLSPYFIPSLIQNYYSDPANKDIKFEFTERRTYEGIKAILNKESDIGFGTKTDHPELDYYPVFTEKLVIAVPSNHPLANRTHASLKELDGMDFIAYSPGCGTRMSVDQLLSRAGVKPHIVMDAPITDIMVASFVSGNMGVSILPQTYGMEHFQIHTLDIDDADSTIRTVHMYWHKQTELLPAVKRFRDYVIAMDPIQKNT